MKVKYILMVLLSSFIGIMSNPEILTASDSVAVFDLERSNMVETKEVPVATKVATVPVAAKATAAPVKTAPAAPKAGQATQVKTAKTAVSSTNISFSWGAQNLVFAESGSAEAGNTAVQVGKMIYGHNYTTFGKITSLRIGDVFSVTVNGKTEKYKVAANPIDGKAGVAVDVVGNLSSGKVYHPKFGNFYTTAFERGWTHDLVLLTCYNNNTQRYIVVADKI